MSASEERVSAGLVWVSVLGAAFSGFIVAACTVSLAWCWLVETDWVRRVEIASFWNGHFATLGLFLVAGGLFIQGLQFHRAIAAERSERIERAQESSQDARGVHLQDLQRRARRVARRLAMYEYIGNSTCLRVIGVESIKTELQLPHDLRDLSSDLTTHDELQQVLDRIRSLEQPDDSVEFKERIHDAARAHDHPALKRLVARRRDEIAVVDQELDQWGVSEDSRIRIRELQESGALANCVPPAADTLYCVLLRLPGPADSAQAHLIPDASAEDAVVRVLEAAGASDHRIQRDTRTSYGRQT